MLLTYSKFGRDASLELYATGKISTLTQKIREHVADIENEAAALLSLRQKEFSKSQVSFWVSVSLLAGITMLMITVMLIITNKQIKLRQKAEKDLKQFNSELEERVIEKTRQITDEQKRYQTLLDNMLEGIQIISYDWKYIYLNDAAVKQSKYRRDELIGCNMMDKYSYEDNPHLYNAMKKCMETKKPARFDNFFKYPDGSNGYFDLSIEPIDEGLFILSMDITERMEREIEKEKRIEEAKEILNKISHDIRQPVSSILGVSTLLDESMISNEEMKSVSTSMRESAILLDQQTRNLTDYVSSLRGAS